MRRGCQVVRVKSLINFTKLVRSRDRGTRDGDSDWHEVWEEKLQKECFWCMCADRNPWVRRRDENHYETMPDGIRALHDAQAKT